MDAFITKKVTGAMNQYLNKRVTLTNAEKDSFKLLQMVSMAFKKGLHKSVKHLIKIVLKQICFFTKKAATGPNGPIFNKFLVYRAANGLDLNYSGALTSLDIDIDR